MKLSNKFYDVAKYIDLVFIPALIVFYGTIASVLNLPNTDVVLTIMGAVDVFLGSLLQISNAQYKKEADTDEQGQ